MRSFTTAGNHPFFQMLTKARYFVLLAFLLVISWAGYAQNVTLNYTTAGPHTFIVPPGVTSITVQTWGAGGGGGGGQNANGGSGGGGGGYTSKTFAVSAGQQYNITVGAGGAGGDGSGGSAGDGGPSQVELNGGAVIVIANGGLKGSQASGTGGNGGDAIVDPDATNKLKGGNGFGGTSSDGGGGGSSAGTALDGVNATSATGASAPAGGGNGGTATGSAGGPGSPPGGGGAGGDDDDGADGGAGGVGRVIIAYTDNTAPTVTNVTSSTDNGTYLVSAAINVTVTFSEPVIVTGTPRIQLNSGTTRYANYTGGTGTNTLTFTYTVVSGDNTSDLDYLNTSAFTLNGGTIKDNANNDANLTLATPGAANSLGFNKDIVINTPAIVTGVTSVPSTGAFKVGAGNITITVTFNKAVTVVGTPTLTLETGATDQVISYSGGSGTTALTFTYIIQSTDNSADLDYVNTNSLTAGTSIKDALNLDANLTLPAPGAAGSLGANSSIKIDNTVPAVSVPDLATADDTGFKNNDNLTNKISGLTFIGTAEADATVEIYSGATLLGSGTATGGNYSIDIIDLSEGTFSITAKATDAAGNVSAVTGALTPNLRIDTTKPDAGTMALTLVQGGPELVTWNFTEAVTNINNGTGVNLVDYNMTGFSIAAATPTYTSIGAGTGSRYLQASLLGRLTSSTNNSNWNGSMKINYNSGTGNVYDEAGNAMDSFNDRPVTDTEPPKLFTGLVYNPAGVITFQVDEELNIAENANITGLTTNPASTFTAVYTGKGTTNTITLTYTGGTAWTDNVTLSYSSVSGNIRDAASPTPNHIVMANEPILLKSITTFSNIPPPNQNYASTGNLVTVTFASSRTLIALPSVTIAGIAATVTPGSGPFTGPFTATATMTAGVPETTIPISITVEETGKITNTIYTTDGSSVIFDKTPPAVTNVSFTSDNGFIGNDYFATNGDYVTLSFTIVENFTPTVTIGGIAVNPIDIIKIGNNYTASVSADPFPQGLVTFSIVVKDLANNTTTKTTTDNGTTVTFDTTPPTVSSITVNPAIINSYASSINGTTPSLNSNQIDFLITFDDPVLGVSNNNIIATKTGSVTSQNNPIIIPVQSDGITSVPFGQYTKYWRIIYSNVSGAGLFKIEVIPSFGNIQNIFGLSMLSGLIGPDYTISLPQPASPVGPISVSTIADNSISLNWGTVTGATHYLAILTTSTTAPVTDGTYVDNDINFGDGTVAQNIPQGTNSVTFNQPPANSAYNIFIYPYALSPFTTGVNNTAIDFNPTASRISRSATFVRDGTFTYPSNIDYKLYTASNIDLERFSVSDGGASTFADGFSTVLNGITLNITNHQNLNTLSLFDGGTQIATTSTINSTVSFSGISFTVPEGQTKTLTIKGTFKSTVTDNQVITFAVPAISAQSTGSTQFLDTTPNVTSGATGNQSKIEVIASKLVFTNPAPPTPVTASLDADFLPNGLPVAVEAWDSNNNLDLDFNGPTTAGENLNSTIQTVTNAGSPQVTMRNVPTGSFTLGKYTFPTNFQYDEGNNDDVVTLTMGAGAPGNVITGTSAVITLKTAFDSYLYSNFSAQNINYELANNQVANISYNGSTGGYKIHELILNDGGADGTAGDSDGSATVLNSLTLGITNPKSIKQIALYKFVSGTWTEIDEQAGSSIVEDGNGYGQITFSGLAGVSAPDDGSLAIHVIVSFNNTADKIIDNRIVQISVTGAVSGTGSKFRGDTGDLINLGTYIGGVTVSAPPSVLGSTVVAINAGAIGPQNTIEVTATRLDFTIQPVTTVAKPLYLAGINEPIAAPRVEARDNNQILDLDYDKNNVDPNYKRATITSPQAGLSISSFDFTNGVLDFPTVANGDPLGSSLYYTSAGVGTLTIQANGLSSNTGGSITCEPINVINVTGTGATAGVTTSDNLAGGAINKSIFGFTLRPQHKVTGHPKLEKFTITFSNSITGVFTNMRIYESKDASFTSAGDNVEVTVNTINGVLVPASNSLLVDFTQPGGVPRDLSDISVAPNGELTYFLVVDISPTTSGSTPTIQPSLRDLGYEDISIPPTNDNTVLSYGSVISDVLGKEFTFNSIFPPTLEETYPFIGQLNVDPNQSTISMTFSVPVWSLDQKITLHDKTAGTVIGDLSATNGLYPAIPNSQSGLSNPVIFTIPVPLTPDHVYYITVPPGDFNGITATDNVGFMDEAGNLFAGISYSGTFYFKTANPNPPNLLKKTLTRQDIPDPTITDRTISGATINAAFDERGKAYFMVVNKNDPKPTKAEIAGTSPTYNLSIPVIARGIIDIRQTTTITQPGLIRVPLTGGASYDVWMYGANDALPTPIEASDTYGSSANNFVIGAAGPTFTFDVPNVIPPTGPQLPVTDITICTDSYQILNKPITINESDVKDFSKNGTMVGPQSFNLLLPSGFQFDVATKADNSPLYGNLVLTGADFSGSGQMRFINTSTLRITFTNQGVSSRDNITITGLRVKSDGIASGNITRLGGQALTDFIDDETEPVAIIRAVSTNGIPFTNDYSIKTYPNKTVAETVTAIPNNFNAPQFTATLIPVPDAKDYGPNVFSGNGVNVDQLSLGAVTLNTPFNIKLTHTDNNGCPSETSTQYTVYDSDAAISGLSNKYGAKNENYFSSNANPPGFSAAAYGNPLHIDQVEFNNLPSYFMDSLVVDVLPNATTVIAGNDWRKVLKTLLVVKDQVEDGDEPGRFYKGYKFDWATVLNADVISNFALENPYVAFRDTTTSRFRNEYFTGGSLGFVEFTGWYQSIANASVQVPLKQSVEIFLPPIPVVEYSQESFLEKNDPGNLPYPQSGSPSNLGTPIYCEAGDLIILNGWPAPSPGRSTGYFTLVDAESGNVLFRNTTVLPGNIVLANGVQDFTNGTLNINPKVFNNSYKNIKVYYRYKDDNSPIADSTYQIIRISANPISSFLQASQIGPDNFPAEDIFVTGKASATNAYCESIPIKFESKPSYAPGAATTANVPFQKYTWDFGDINSGASNSDTISSTPSHSFRDIGKFKVTHTVRSIYGCANVKLDTASLIVGSFPSFNDIPFDMRGISTAEPMTFTILNSASPNSPWLDAADLAGISYSNITNQDWNYGDNSSDATGVHQYTNPGHYVVTLTATTSIGPNLTLINSPGCTKSFSRPILVLDKKVLSANSTYVEDFEVSDGNWQIKADFNNNVTPSWKRGSPNRPASALINVTPDQSANIMGTGNLTTNYTAGERSFLYPPVVDFVALSRPMISFFSAWDLGFNGTVLEYSTDNRNVADPLKVWKTVGDNTSGVNWFNAQIIASKPGNQPSGDFGWSNTSGQWVESKHSLSNINSSERQNVTFRFAFASQSNQAAGEGFALDYFRVGDRTRTVLIENFTNKGGNNSSEKDVSEFLKTFIGSIGTEIVKINYHVGFPGPAADPFNVINPADPSARALYYNVAKTPTTYMDGFTDKNNPLFTQWAQSTYDLQSLNLAGADIAISQTLSSTTGAYSVDVTVTARKQLPANTVLHVGFLEQEISLANNLPTNENKFEYVLKKLLPSGAGTRFNQVLNANQTRTFTGLEWTPDTKNLYAPSNDLVLVAFLQNETTLEVYQSELIAGISDPPVVTGIWDILPEQVNVYPNPASSEFRVELPAFVQNEANIHLIDLMGRRHDGGKIAAGSNAASVNVESLSEGIYILEIGSDKTGIIRKKIMVVMNK